MVIFWNDTQGDVDWVTDQPPLISNLKHQPKKKTRMQVLSCHAMGRGEGEGEGGEMAKEQEGQVGRGGM